MPDWNERLAIYDQRVDLCPRFERKGKSMPYTSANSYMFSLLNKDAELGIRLSKESGERFKEEHNSTIFEVARRGNEGLRADSGCDAG